MDRLAPSLIATSILDAPTWARLGIGVRDPRMRERAAEEIAARICQAERPAEPDTRQLPLSLEEN